MGESEREREDGSQIEMMRKDGERWRKTEKNGRDGKDGKDGDWLSFRFGV